MLYASTSGMVCAVDVEIIMLLVTAKEIISVEMLIAFKDFMVTH